MPFLDATSQRRPRTAARSRRSPTGRTLAVLNEIARIATEDLDLRPLLQRITDALARRFGWDLVALVRIDREGDCFVCEAVSSRRPTQVFVGYGRELGSGVVGQVAARGTPILIDDATLHPGFVDTLPGARSEICVPVKHRGTVVAILNAESARRAAFRGLLPLVETIADQIAGAIAGARFLEETRRRAAALEVLSEVSRIALDAGTLTDVLDRVAGYVRRTFDLSLAAVLLLDRTRRRCELHAVATADLEPPSRASWPVDEGTVGRAIVSGRPQLVTDARAEANHRPVFAAATAELAVPIRYHDRVRGAFLFASTTAAPFTPENCRLLMMLADQIAGAINLAAVNRRLSHTKAQLERANQQLREANRVLDRLTVVDALTHVANRRGFDQVLEHEWRRATRNRTQLSLLLVDVDHFKQYNDAHGHQQGDQCLRAVAGLLSRCVGRAGDLVARYGGEEFAVLLPETTLDAAAALAETIRAGVETLAIPHQSSAASSSVTVSVGIATSLPSQPVHPSTMVAAADRALYRAKREGRNRVVGEAPSGHPPIPPVER